MLLASSSMALPQRLIIGYLRLLSLPVRRAHRGRVIAVAGSIGKTTTRTFLTDVLSPHLRVLSTGGGFNSEIGLLLSLLGVRESGYSSARRWLRVLAQATAQAMRDVWSPRRYDVFVLEYGSDQPGDMQRLIRIMAPDTCIITAATPVHHEAGQFADTAATAAEDGQLALHTAGTVLLNADDPLVAALPVGPQAQRLYYGAAGGQLPLATGVSAVQQGSAGVSFALHIAGRGDAQLALPVLGAYHAAVFAPVAWVAVSLGLSMEQVQQAAAGLQPPAGRGRLLAGVGGSTLWDSTYNASPPPVLAALATLAQLPVAGRRIAVLGNMNELGAESARYHEEVGAAAGAAGLDEVFFVSVKPDNVQAFTRGFTRAAAVAAARSGGVQPLFRVFGSSGAVAEYLRPRLQQGDFVLLKGSQNKVFLERAVRALLADPADSRLTCRTDAYWEGQ